MSERIVAPDLVDALARYAAIIGSLEDEPWNAAARMALRTVTPPMRWQATHDLACVVADLRRAGVSSQQDDERKERWHLFLDDELVTMRFALADEKQEPWKSKAPRLHKQITDEQDRRASLLRSSLQPSQPAPEPVHDEADDAPSGPLEWRRIADNVFRLSRWLDSIGRADWGHELRRASGELSRAHDLAQPSQMDVDALAHPRPFKLEGDEWGGTVEGVCAYDIADMNIEWTYCPFCGGRLHRLFGVSPQDGSESR